MQRLFRVTPPLGTHGPALATSSIPPLSVRPCGTQETFCQFSFLQTSVSGMGYPLIGNANHC